MTSNRKARGFLVALCLVAACEGGNDARQQTIRQDPDRSFAGFAALLYNRLTDTPLDLYPAEVGLFGDLSVVSGETVIMGRYRYVTDLSGSEPQARMVFLVREEGSRGDPIPVMLHFTARNGLWHLEDATHSAGDPPSNPFEAALLEDFDSWISDAVEKSRQEWLSSG